MTDVYFKTNGRGLWSNAKKNVRIVDIQVPWVLEGYSSFVRFGECKVYFDPKTWDVLQDGLIYTDRHFLKELRVFLKEHGLAYDDIDYSEQGMQGDDFVSFDIGEDFIRSWEKKFDIVLTELD